MDFPSIERISECFIKPKYEIEESNESYHLAPWDLAMLSSHYIQKGLLFVKPKNNPNYSTDKLLESLKESLSLTLVHFHPLAGRLATLTDDQRGESVVFVDCKKGPGVGFIHATLDVTISNIVSSANVPLVVRSFFDHDRAVNYEGHFRSLLSVQVTELLDGVFIGCSMNHVLGDGTSYWHFWNVWTEIHTANGKDISVSRLPIHQRWFPDGYGPVALLPFTCPDQFVTIYEESSELRERFFHFSSKSIARLKANANEESNTAKISSFQALSAFVWRAIVRANQLPHDQITNCRLAVNNRSRLDPPLSQDYFGNALNAVKATTTAGQLLEQTLGWVALMLHQAVINHTDKVVRDFVKGWLESPFVYPITMFDPNSVMIGGSPRFDMYGNEFGLGKAVAARSGHAHKYGGKVSAYPGHAGKGSVDLEICLTPDSMTALESDEEFMGAVSLP
ncbi:hypothetical protein Cgig2_023326 [Carnegiea gigantea]|uniref:Uncharacterized protein n=1 Tax=Carnegiea gigantea TaxID=171969 RepID=A0A9Q1K370_9CARY|nr:hypothetical protein Cgig2_023326 [Carnegiea gigantea]